MFFPKLKPYKLSENTISTFGGIDKNAVGIENLFFDTQNTTSANFPLVSTREKRVTLTTLNNVPSALHTTNGITFVLGSSLYYNNVLQFSGLDTTSKKQIVSMGSNIIVFPDNYYIDTMTLNENGVCKEKGYLNCLTSFNQVDICVYPCILGMSYPFISDTQPQKPTDSMLWLDISSIPNKMFIYSSQSNTWSDIVPTHICIMADHIHEGIKVGDGVEIRGIGDGIDGQHIIAGVEESIIYISGYIDRYTEISLGTKESYSIERSVPVMDFVCEHQNRLFGCRYGLNKQGEFVNEIYASKLGDPTNWNVYQGLSTDSYSASCGSEGEFTGIASYMGNVLFFKENSIHRLHGTKPSNFTLYNDNYPGIKKGSYPSLCICNGSLFYHSNEGIYSYSGSSPVFISRALGFDKFTDAVASVGKNMYFVCMTDKNQNRQLYVYDFIREIWHRHDSSNYLFLSKYDNNILGIKRFENKYTLELLFSSEIPEKCQSFFSSSMKIENNFDWYAESGLIGLSFDDCKYLNKLKVRVEIDKDSSFSIYVQTDSEQNWELFETLTTTKLTSRTLHILPPRCDHFRLKFAGKGNFKLYSITKVIENAGEVV